MTRAGRTVVVLFAAALLGRIVRAVPQPQILEPLAKLLPAAVQGWTPVPPDDLYDQFTKNVAEIREKGCKATC